MRGSGSSGKRFDGDITMSLRTSKALIDAFAATFEEHRAKVGDKVTMTMRSEPFEWAMLEMLNLIRRAGPALGEQHKLIREFYEAEPVSLTKVVAIGPGKFVIEPSDRLLDTMASLHLVAEGLKE